MTKILEFPSVVRPTFNLDQATPVLAVGQLPNLLGLNSDQSQSDPISRPDLELCMSNHPQHCLVNQASRWWPGSSVQLTVAIGSTDYITATVNSSFTGLYLQQQLYVQLQPHGPAYLWQQPYLSFIDRQGQMIAFDQANGQDNPQAGQRWLAALSQVMGHQPQLVRMPPADIVIVPPQHTDIQNYLASQHINSSPSDHWLMLKADHEAAVAQALSQLNRYQASAIAIN